MDLLNLLVKISVDDQASPQMESISAGMIAKAQLMGDAIKSAVMGAVQSVKGLIQGALDAYGQFEQMKGGMETFFGSSAQTVIENAQKAYETAGMSANQYMQNVSNFATTLIESVKKRRAQALQSSTGDMVQALQDQYEAAKEAYEAEYEAMQSSFQKQNKALQRSLSDQLDAAREAQQERVEAAQESFEKEREALSEAQEKEVEEYEKATEARIALIDQEYTERLKLIDEDEYNRVKAIEDQIKGLEGQTKAEREALKKREDAQKEAELRSAVATAKTAEQRQKAQQQLTAFLEKTAQEEREAARKAQIDTLKDQREVIKQQAKERRDQLKEQYQGEREEYVESRKQGLKDMQEAHTADMKELTKDQQGRLKQLQKANAAELKEMQRANEDQLDAVQEGQRQQLDALKRAQDARLSQLKKAMDEEKKLLTNGTNDFIETTTEDQQHAAELSDMAVKDMADNAAKMGTPIQMLQDAYRGFAMGNFTMLDNLHLGFAGTKSEMERLLETAESISAKNGEMVDYSIDSFADIVDAIHVVQEEYGITGTAMEEGATTYEGAIGRVRAAWENWLVSLTDPNMDVAESTRALMDSVGKAAAIIIPRVAEIIKELTSYISEHGPEIWEQFKQAMMDALPDEWKEKLQGIMDKLSEFMEHLPETIELVKNLGIAFMALQAISSIVGIFTSLKGAFDLVSGGIGLLSGGAGLGALSGAFAGIGTVVKGVIAFFTGPAGWVAAIAAVAAGIIGFIATNEDAQKAIGDAWEAVKSFFAGLPDFFKGVFDRAGQALQSIGGFFADRARDIGGAWDDLKKNTAEAWRQSAESVRQWTNDISQKVKPWMEGLRNGINNGWNGIVSFMQSIPSRIGGFFSNAGNWLLTAGRNIITGFLNGLKQKFQDVQNWVGSIGKWIADHKGPKEYDLGLLVDNGRWIMQSLETGLRKGFPLIEDTVGEIADMIQGTDFDATASLSMDAKAVKAQPEEEGIRTFGQRKAQREQRETTIVLMLDRTEFARAVYKANNDETQRVGLRLAGGYA